MEGMHQGNKGPGKSYKHSYKHSYFPSINPVMSYRDALMLNPVTLAKKVRTKKVHTSITPISGHTLSPKHHTLSHVQQLSSRLEWKDMETIRQALSWDVNTRRGRMINKNKIVKFIRRLIRVQGDKKTNKEKSIVKESIEHHNPYHILTVTDLKIPPDKLTDTRYKRKRKKSSTNIENKDRSYGGDEKTSAVVYKEKKGKNREGSTYRNKRSINQNMFANNDDVMDQGGEDNEKKRPNDGEVIEGGNHAKKLKKQEVQAGTSTLTTPSRTVPVQKDEYKRMMNLEKERFNKDISKTKERQERVSEERYTIHSNKREYRRLKVSLPQHLIDTMIPHLCNYQEGDEKESDFRRDRGRRGQQQISNGDTTCKRGGEVTYCSDRNREGPYERQQVRGYQASSRSPLDEEPTREQRNGPSRRLPDEFDDETALDEYPRYVKRSENGSLRREEGRTPYSKEGDNKYNNE